MIMRVTWLHKNEVMFKGTMASMDGAVFDMEVLIFDFLGGSDLHDYD